MAFNLPRIKNKTEANNSTVRHNHLDNIIDNFFNEFYSFPLSTLNNMEGNLLPRIDISETDLEYCLEVEMPGVNQQNIELKIDNNILSLKGQKEQNSEDKGENYHMRGRHYGSFQRSISLPSNVNEEDIQAHFENGILCVKIPKKEQGKAKKIEIKS